MPQPFSNHLNRHTTIKLASNRKPTQILLLDMPTQSPRRNNSNPRRRIPSLKHPTQRRIRSKNSLQT
jgi:hypothetical protein